MQSRGLAPTGPMEPATPCLGQCSIPRPRAHPSVSAHTSSALRREVETREVHVPERGSRAPTALRDARALPCTAYLSFLYVRGLGAQNHRWRCGTHQVLQNILEGFRYGICLSHLALGRGTVMESFHNQAPGRQAHGRQTSGQGRTGPRPCTPGQTDGHSLLLPGTGSFYWFQM